MINNPYWAVSAVIIGMGFIQGSFGLLTALLPGVLAEAGYSSSIIGLSAAVASAGFLIGTLTFPALIDRIGHIRTFATLAAVLSIGALILSISVNIWLYTFVRGAMMMALAGLFMVCEGWISSRTDDDWRGRVLAAYTLVYKLSMSLMPLLLLIYPVANISGNADDSQNSLPLVALFMVASAFFSLALIPVALTHASAPTNPGEAKEQDKKVGPNKRPKMSLFSVYQLAPAAIIGVVASSLSSSSITNLTPVYASNLGYGVAGGAALFSVMQLGNLIAQWPAGWLSDKYDRRHVMIGLAVLSVIASLIISAFGSWLPFWILMVLAGVWGGVSMSIYSICMAHATDYAKPEEIIPTCSTLLFSFSLGMIIGPIWGGQLMDWIGPSGIFINSAFFMSAYVGFLAWRLGQRTSRPAAERDPFVHLSATSPRLGEIDPRSPPKAGATPAHDKVLSS